MTALRNVPGGESFRDGQDGRGKASPVPRAVRRGDVAQVVRKTRVMDREAKHGAGRRVAGARPQWSRPGHPPRWSYSAGTGRPAFFARSRTLATRTSCAFGAKKPMPPV